MLEKDDVIGDYKLEKFLGRGQFGEVWLAEKQLQFSTRKVRHALKFLLNINEEIDLKATETEIDTWIEASGHPNVMSVIDMMLYKNYIIIISEFAEGGSLLGWLRQNGGKAPSVEKGLEMMIGILHGLEHLHSKNVVHRDLKPDNILLQGNFPRITDFGISRIVSSASLSTKAVGSPAYMSPESFNGNKSPQNDIWSAGVILYEILAGTYPFSADNIYGLISAIQSGEYQPLPESISPELRKIVETALQKDCLKRFQTSQEMRLAIEKALFQLKTENTKNAVEDNQITKSAETIPLHNLSGLEATLPSPEILESQETGYSDKTQELPQIETSNATTQPMITLADTQPANIEIDQNAEESEQKRLQKRKTELADINLLSEMEVEREHKKSRYLIAGGIGGSLLLLALLGWVIIPMFTTSSGVSNINTNKVSNDGGTNKTNVVNLPRNLKNSTFSPDSIKNEDSFILSIYSDKRLEYSYNSRKDKGVVKEDIYNEIVSALIYVPPNKRSIFIRADANLGYDNVVEILTIVRKSAVDSVCFVVSATERNESTNFLTIKIPALLDDQGSKPLSPNPLLLLVSIDASNKIKLNNESFSSLENLSAKLDEVFKQRADNGVFRGGTNEVEKTVFIKASRSIKYGEVAKIIDAVKGSGAFPIGLQIDDLPN